MKKNKIRKRKKKKKKKKKNHNSLEKAYMWLIIFQILLFINNL